MKKILTFLSVLFLSLTLVTFDANQQEVLLAEESEVVEEVENDTEGEITLLEIRTELLKNVVNHRKNELIEIDNSEFTEESFDKVVSILDDANESAKNEDLVTKDESEKFLFDDKLDEINYHLNALVDIFDLLETPKEAAIKTLEDAIKKALDYLATEEVKEKYAATEVEDEEVEQPIIAEALKLVEAAKNFEITEETTVEQINAEIAKISEEKLEAEMTKALNAKIEELDALVASFYDEGGKLNVEGISEEAEELLVEVLEKHNKEANKTKTYQQVLDAVEEIEALPTNAKEEAIKKALDHLSSEEVASKYGTKENGVLDSSYDLVEAVKNDEADIDTITIEKLDEELEAALSKFREQLIERHKVVNRFILNEEPGAYVAKFTEVSITKLAGALAEAENQFNNLDATYELLKSHFDAIDHNEVLESVLVAKLGELKDVIWDDKVVESEDEEVEDEVIKVLNPKYKEALLQKFVDEVYNVAKELSEDVNSDYKDVLEYKTKLEKFDFEKIEVENKDDLKELIKFVNENELDIDLEQYEDLMEDTNATKEQLESAVEELNGLIVNELLLILDEALLSAKEFYIAIVPEKHDMKKIVEIRNFILATNGLEKLENLHVKEILKEAIEKLAVKNLEAHLESGEKFDLVETEKSVDTIIAELVEDLTKEDWSNESWKNLDDARNKEAKIWKEFSDKIDAVVKAIDDLKEKTDLTKEDLQNAIDNVKEEYPEEDYTEESYKDLKDAIDAAQAKVDSEEELTTDQIQELIDAMKDEKVIEKLVTKVQDAKDKLKASINKLEKEIDEDKHTPASVKEAKKVVSKAKELLENEKATLKELEEEKAKVDGVVLKDQADFEKLAAEIARAEAIIENPEGYIQDENFENLRDVVLVAAKEVFENKDSTQDKIDAEVSALKLAITNLTRETSTAEKELRDAILKANDFVDKYVISLTGEHQENMQESLDAYYKLREKSFKLIAHPDVTAELLTEEALKYEISTLTDKDNGIFKELHQVAKEVFVEKMKELSKLDENKELVNATIVLTEEGTMDVTFQLLKDFEDFKDFKVMENVLNQLKAAGVVSLKVEDKELELSDLEEEKVMEFAEHVFENTSEIEGGLEVEYTATIKREGILDIKDQKFVAKIIPVNEAYAVVRTAEELEAALQNVNVEVITIKGTLGATDVYTIYNVGRSVVIQGAKDAKVYGTFIVKANDVTIDNLAIQNKGDLKGESSNHRGAIYVFAENVTITNNVITNGLASNEGLSNAIQLMSPKANNPLSNYVVTNNTIKGHDKEVTNWSSSGIVIAQGFEPGSAGEYVEVITASAKDYQTLLNNNTFENNKIDLTHQDWSKDSDEVVIYPVNEAYAVVRTAAELKDALLDEKVLEIKVKGTLGSTDEYTIYNVDRSVVIQGAKDAKVYGTFIVKANDVTIDGLQIQNKGDLQGESSNHRGAIYVFAENVTITNNVITNGLSSNEGLSNAIQLMSPKANNPLSNYVVKDNTIKGHDNEVTNWSSSGIVIVQGYNPESIGGAKAESITATEDDYKALLTNNTLTSNKIDLTHQDWSKDSDEVVLYSK